MRKCRVGLDALEKISDHYVSVRNGATSGEVHGIALRSEIEWCIGYDPSQLAFHVRNNILRWPWEETV